MKDGSSNIRQDNFPGSSFSTTKTSRTKNGKKKEERLTNLNLFVDDVTIDASASW
jgi:hypothetical protein